MERHKRHVRQIDFQTVLDVAALIGIAVALVLAADDTAFIGCTELCASLIRSCPYFLHVGSVTSAHKLIVDDEVVVNREGLFARDGHTAHITATEEGTDET